MAEAEKQSALALGRLSARQINPQRKRKMRKSLNASVLLLVLCCPAFAGDMLTPPAAPPPAPATYTQPNDTPDLSDDDSSDPAVTKDSTTQGISAAEITVSFFENLLAIL
jgi:hypothetical protein